MRRHPASNYTAMKAMYRSARQLGKTRVTLGAAIHNYLEMYFANREPLTTPATLSLLDWRHLT